MATRYDLLKELLGHSNIKTTLIYTNVSDTSLRKISSPLDTLKKIELYLLNTKKEIQKCEVRKREFLFITY